MNIFQLFESPEADMQADEEEYFVKKVTELARHKSDLLNVLSQRNRDRLLKLIEKYKSWYDDAINLCKKSNKNCIFINFFDLFVTIS